MITLLAACQLHVAAPPLPSPEPSAVSVPTDPPPTPRPVPPPPLPPPPPAGPLSGLLVFLSPGHGRLVHITKDGRGVVGWGWQRDTQNGLREDQWTAAFSADLLAPALESRGATVLSLRERDRHATAVLADDADPTFFSSRPGAPVPAALAEGTGSTLLAPDAWCRWTLTAPETGAWYLYTRWTAAPEHDPAASYVVHAESGARRTDVDQRRHDGMWWPIGRLQLNAGEQVTVTLQGSGAGSLSADAVRLGGGTFQLDDPRLGAADPVPWFEVATSQHLPHLGGPEELLWLPDGARISDMRFRARWTAWASDPADEAVFLSVHTNAGSGNGTIVFYGVDPDAVPAVPARPRSKSLGAALASQLKTSLRTVASTWQVDEARPGNYSEISPYWSDVDGAIIELGFHDKASDARRLLDPAFQQAAVTGIVDAVQAWRTNASP